MINPINPLWFGVEFFSIIFFGWLTAYCVYKKTHDELLSFSVIPITSVIVFLLFYNFVLNPMLG
jgi:hypothetical protein